MGARGIEFDWKYVQMSIDSNISLVRCCELPWDSALVAGCGQGVGGVMSFPGTVS